MGADANVKPIVCSRAAELAQNQEKELLVNSELLMEEHSTLPLAKATELVENCTNLSHTDELNKFKEVGAQTPILPSQIGTDFNYKRKIVWFNAIGMTMLHITGIIGIFLAMFGFCQFKTTLYSLWLIYAAGQGVTMGAHRHFCHRSFKCATWLKLVLLYMHTLAGQNCLYVWVRDHRQHHKFSDTDADPHNANRGFFFSHVGWLVSRKHPKVFEYGVKIDMSDIEADYWIMFQKRYYKLLYTIFALLLPTSLPIILWGEDPFMALMVGYFARTILNLNGTWLVNSAAHLYGTRPYDNTMFPVESMFVALMAVGEGWHNYHHAFPWDYRASELGMPLNLTCFFIDWLAKFGVIYDRREATSNMVKNRVMKTGDKSHHIYGTPEGKSQFKTLFGIWRHPLNPTYTSLHNPKPKLLKSDGYALAESELTKAELDDRILSQENAELEKTYNKKSDSNLMVKLEQLAGDENSNYLKTHDSNNNEDSNNNLVKRNKSQLNVNEIANECMLAKQTIKESTSRKLV